MYVDYVVWNTIFNSSFLDIYLEIFPFWFKILKTEENLRENVEF